MAAKSQQENWKRIKKNKLFKKSQKKKWLFLKKVFQVFSIQVKEIKINYNLNTKAIKGSLARL